MRRPFLALLSSGLLAVTLAGVAAAGQYVDYDWGPGPNQGEASKVIPLENSCVDTCTNPVPSQKFEGDFGKSVTIVGTVEVYGVTVKSGRDASFDLACQGSGECELSGDKDISNLVVWVCPPAPPGGDYYIVK